MHGGCPRPEWSGPFQYQHADATRLGGDPRPTSTRSSHTTITMGSPMTWTRRRCLRTRSARTECCSCETTVATTAAHSLRLGLYWLPIWSTWPPMPMPPPPSHHQLPILMGGGAASHTPCRSSSWGRSVHHRPECWRGVGAGLVLRKMLQVRLRLFGVPR